jgi:hypothetical protein
MPEYKIPELVRLVENGEIDIPELQREFVWSDNQVRDLAESIYKYYPIGLIILYEIPDALRRKQERFWVLDGQQRLLSLTLIMKGKVEAIKDGEKKTVKLDIWFNPQGEGRFELRTPRGGENWIKLSDLLQLQRRADLENLLRHKWLDPEEQEKISTLWGIFRGDYKVPTHHIYERLELDDLGNIFVRTNFAGTRVKGADVYSSMIAVAYRGLVERFREFCTKLPIEIDYGIIIRTFVAFISDGKVKLASRVLDQAKELRQILDKKKDEIESIIGKMKGSISEVMSIFNEAGITSLPTENVLPVMSYYFYKRGPLPEKERNGILKWFVLASLFRRYSASVETRLNEDLTTIKDGGDYKDLIKNIELWEGDLKERIKGYIDLGEWSHLVIYILLKQSNAKDFLTGEDITMGNSTVHHIFPRKYLIDTGYAKLLNNIANITLITYQSNQKLSAEIPENYLSKVPAEIRKSHYIPEDRESWKFEKIEAFTEQRKNLLKASVEKFFEDI